MPRHSFSVRDRARAGDVWRAFQELAVLASTHAGWPPDRYRREGSAFVVRGMTVVHEREAAYGEDLRGRTWVSRFRKGSLSTREVRLFAGSPEHPIARGTQEWVHVSANLQITKAPESLVEAFPLHDAGGTEPAVALPPFTPLEGARFRFEFDAWHTWMDPLAHANHPAYVDWCDEALSRHLGEHGLDPVGLVPVAEEASYRSGVRAPERVSVESRVVGVTAEGAAVLSHQVFSSRELRAKLTTVRTLAEGGEALLGLLTKKEGVG